MDKTNPVGTGSFSLNRQDNTDIGDYSFAEGQTTTASGANSHAEGYQTRASNFSSHAEGSLTTSSGSYSHAEGYETIASNNSSHAEGQSTKASEKYSHAEGYKTEASGQSSHAEGYQTVASGTGSHTEGSGTTASTSWAHAEGLSTTASASGAHAEGYNTTASGANSHAEGSNTTASGIVAHTEGSHTTASENSAHAEGYGTTASGNYSHAEGENVLANGRASHAEGSNFVAEGAILALDTTQNIPRFVISCGRFIDTSTFTQNESYVELIDKNNTIYTYIILEDCILDSNRFTIPTFGQTMNDTQRCDIYVSSMNCAEGDFSHTEGASCQSIGRISHAEGQRTQATGVAAHAEGWFTIASGHSSHAQGSHTTASENSTHAEGYGTTASGDYAHAEGSSTTASGQASHSEGWGAKASGDYSHAEGNTTTASGIVAHAEGYVTTASGDYAHAEGYSTKAEANQHAQGHWNSSATAGYHNGITGTAFIIGNGTSDSRSNAFRVTYAGDTYAKAAYNATGADYAEFFEWEDSNPFNEDRRGYFVTLNNDKIKIATPEDDFILGIVSGQPAIIGNSDEEWTGRYILDEFGSFISEEFEYEEKTFDSETGEEIITIKTGTKYKENPEYDPSQAYIQRQDRAEWAAVGMLGVLSVRDDGTCQVNGYCSIAEDGTATMSLSGYRVIKRINDNIIKIIFR